MDGRFSFAMECCSASGMSLFATFGYGSLVNLDTLRTPYVSAWPARLKGWRRIWLPRPRVERSFAPVDGLAFLSAEMDPSSQIDGMIVVKHADSLSALDAREALYRRHRVELGDIELLRPGDEPDITMPLHIYVANDYAPESADPPRILRSYLDAVFQGYRTHFSEQGLTRFLASTANFHLDILEDRHDPVYPRAVVLTRQERELFDRVRPTRIASADFSLPNSRATP